MYKIGEFQPMPKLTSEQIMGQLLMVGGSTEKALMVARENHNKVSSIQEVLDKIYG